MHQFVAIFSAGSGVVLRPTNLGRRHVREKKAEPKHEKSRVLRESFMTVYLRSKKLAAN